ncbi:MAG: cupredoxin family copper-binding protein [Candidatus Paceibacterota bacterium]
MNKYIYILIIAILLIGGALFISGQKTAVNSPVAENQSQTSQETSIKIVDFSFDPGDITVKAGTKITWTNEDSAPHEITSATFASGILNKGQSFSATLSEKGIYDYHCSLHPSMKGKITVE